MSCVQALSSHIRQLCAYWEGLVPSLHHKAKQQREVTFPCWYHDTNHLVKCCRSTVDKENLSTFPHWSEIWGYNKGVVKFSIVGKTLLTGILSGYMYRILMQYLVVSGFTFRIFWLSKFTLHLWTRLFEITPVKLVLSVFFPPLFSETSLISSLCESSIQHLRVWKCRRAPEFCLLGWTQRWSGLFLCLFPVREAYLNQ